MVMSSAPSPPSVNHIRVISLTATTKTATPPNAALSMLIAGPRSRTGVLQIADTAVTVAEQLSVNLRFLSNTTHLSSAVLSRF